MTREQRLLEWERLHADLEREDGRWERHCPHGTGHTIGHRRGWLWEGYEDIHGCCGCCAEWPRMEYRPRGAA